MIMDGVGVDLLEQRELARPGSRMPLAQSSIGMVVSCRPAQARHQHAQMRCAALLLASQIHRLLRQFERHLSDDSRIQEARHRRRSHRQDRRIRGPPSGEPVAAVVARGEAEIGFLQVAELIHVPGVDFVGTVPGEHSTTDPLRWCAD